MSKPSRLGGRLMMLAGLAGTVAAAYDYLTPTTGIDHTGGVILVLVSSLLMLAAAFGVLALEAGALANFLVFLILLDIAGTGTAAWFLESGLLLAAMAIAAVGLLLWLTSGKRGA